MGIADRTTRKARGPSDGEPASPGAVDPAGATIASGEPSTEPGDAAPSDGERYETGAEIARGGMGRVVEATDTVLGRVVAVKEALTTDPATLRRFLRETRITARLEHPGIVPVYDAGTMPDGSPYYVMRKVSGLPLERLVREKAALGERLALVQNVVAAAQAVAHAHQRGVLHRDLKPANILIGELNETVVIDWGLAKVTDETDDDPSIRRIEPSAGHGVQTKAGSVFGTPGFMSPEQLSGYNVDARSDVYALGATLYFVLAQRPPHHAESGDAMMARAAAGPPPPIASIVRGVPRDLASIIDTALAFHPAQRYANAGALALDLQRFLTGQLVASKRYSPGERLARFVRRHRVPVVALTAAVLALAIGGAIAVSRVLAEQDRTRDALAVALYEQQQAKDALVAMTLNQARTLLPTNPTAALAVVRPLAATGRWREVRAIAAAARHGGACVGLPGPLQSAGVVISPGGGRAASVGFDGSIWVHELAARRSRELGTLAARRSSVGFAGDGGVLAYDGDTLVVFDAETGARRDLPHAGPILHASATSRSVFVVLDGGALHRLELATGVAQPLAVTGARSTAPSRDGRTLAVATTDGLVLLDLEREAPPVRVGAGATSHVQWDARGTSLAMYQGDGVALVTLQPAPAITERRPLDEIAGIGASRGALFALMRHGLEQIVGGERRLVRMHAANIGVSTTRGEAPVIGHRGGSIMVAGEHMTLQLRAPSEEVSRLAASPASRYVVATVPGRLLVWDVDALLPRVEQVRDAQTLAVAAHHEVVLGDASGDWRWRDLDTGAEVAFRAPRGLYVTYTNDRGDPLVLAPGGSGADLHLLVVQRARRSPVAIEGEVSSVWVHPDRITVGTATGEVMDLSTTSTDVTQVIARPSPVVAIGADGPWRAARWADGTIWRRHADGREQLAKVTPISTAGMPIHQLADGRTCTLSGARIECWHVDGSVTTLATLPSASFGTTIVGDQLVAPLHDRSIYRVDLATGKLRSVTSSGGVALSVAPVVGLGVTTLPDHRIEVIDLVANASWTLGAGFPHTKSAAAITRDGALVAVVSNMRHLVTWRLVLPDGPAATARWIDEITNASAENGASQLSWH